MTLQSSPSTLMQCNAQWMSRPADERFTSVQEMIDYKQAIRQRSRAAVVSSRAVTAVPLDNAQGLQIAGPSGAQYNPTHWAFGQLAQRAGAPAGYLRTLPAPMAADCINYGLKHARDVEEIGILLNKPEDGGAGNLVAATGPNYGRIWDVDILEAIKSRGLLEDFTVPGEFGRAVTVTKANTTLFAGDQDMFVFLADERNRIEVPNRRDGQPGSLARGFFVWNSEVGSATFGTGTFLFDYVCMNRIVWGATGYKEIKLRHSSGAPDRFIEEVTPVLHAYADGSAKPVQDALRIAQERKIDNLDSFLSSRFTKSMAANIAATHIAEEGRPMETVWDVVTGATAYARGMKHQNERVQIERIAGDLLND